MTFAARVASDRLLTRSMGAPAPAAMLDALRSRANAMPLGLVETHAVHDGCERSGGILAFLTPIRDVPWLAGARWLSLEEGVEAAEAATDDDWELAPTDVVIGCGKPDHTWLVANARQELRALHWRSVGGRRMRSEPTAAQTWPELIAAFCASTGRFELQDEMVGDHDDERTLRFVPAS